MTENTFLQHVGETARNGQGPGCCRVNKAVELPGCITNRGEPFSDRVEFVQVLDMEDWPEPSIADAAS